MFALLESGASDMGGVKGVPVLVESRSQVLEVVDDEPELDAEDAVGSFGRSGVCLLRMGGPNAS